MIYELSQDFGFEAAHTLKRTVPLAEYAPSMVIHGHSYRATVTVRGAKGASGMVEKFAIKKNKNVVLDLFYLREAIEKVRLMLDHKFLDEVEGLQSGTLENLCEFILNRISFDNVSKVTVSRPATGDSCTLYKEG